MIINLNGDLLTPALWGGELMIFRNHFFYYYLFFLAGLLESGFEVFLREENSLVSLSCVLEIKSSVRGFRLEFSYVFTRKSSCGCSVGASSHLDPSLLDFFLSIFWTALGPSPQTRLLSAAMSHAGWRQLKYHPDS